LEDIQMAKPSSEKAGVAASSQVVRGTLNLSEITHLEPDFPIKIILFRDCRILATFPILEIPDNRIIQYRLAFSRQEAKPMGVHFLIGPGDISDEDLTSFSQGYQTYIPASKFDRGGAATLDVTLPDSIYVRWPLICRRYTIRGRVVCRRIVWDLRQHKFVLCETPVRGATVTAYVWIVSYGWRVGMQWVRHTDVHII
jgi:hypothetical protein